MGWHFYRLWKSNVSKKSLCAVYKDLIIKCYCKNILLGQQKTFIDYFSERETVGKGSVVFLADIK